MEHTAFNLPSIEDFKKGGIFNKLRFNNEKKLPIELMKYVFSDYVDILFKQKRAPTKKTITLIREYCISMKKQALKEEKEQRCKTQKDIEIKQLEEKIKEFFDNYYKNLYKHCTCTRK